MQFRLWQSHLGYLLHPTIEQHEHMRIADVGTGTGLVRHRTRLLDPLNENLSVFSLANIPYGNHDADIT